MALNFQDYVSSESLSEKYTKYQQRYAENIRESDRILLNLIGQVIEEKQSDSLKLLDIGCSTGNLLIHIKKAFPNLQLTGGDLMKGAIEQCRQNPELTNITFNLLNILDFSEQEQHQAQYDIIVANAVLYLFDDDNFQQAIKQIGKALKPSGFFLNFDFYHPFPQSLIIIEKSRSHPDGLPLHFRPFSEAENSFKQAHFNKVDFQPFQIPIDLIKDQTFGENQDGFEDLNSYTVKTEEQKRLLFRGALFQPWCHLVAQK